MRKITRKCGVFYSALTPLISHILPFGAIHASNTFSEDYDKQNDLEKVEGDIHSTYYFEDKSNFTFETYISIHRNTYNEMDKATSYPTLGEGTRVPQLLANITTRDLGLTAAMVSV